MQSPRWRGFAIRAQHQVKQMIQKNKLKKGAKIYGIFIQGTDCKSAPAGDSVFFNAPEHPFHGTYAVRFFIDERGWVYKNARNNIFKMELTNDSTLLLLNKGGIMTPREMRPWNKIR